MNTPQTFSSRYKVLSQIGRGGMGEVFKAWDNVLQKEVAIKFLNQGTGADPRMRKCFYQEARAFALLRHPHVLKLYDYGTTQDGILYIAMELVQGCSLHGLKSANLTLATSIDLISQILDALSLAHARGLVHLDIKAENVLVTYKNNHLWTKLADFGLATLPFDTQDILHPGFGTPAYMSPEQILNQSALIGPCSDIYSTGILLFELLCGKLPFDEKTSIQTLKAQLYSPIPALDFKPQFTLTPPLADALTQIVNKSLAKKSWERFISASEFKNQLRSLEIPAQEQPGDSVIDKIRADVQDHALTSGVTDIISDDIGSKIHAVKTAQDSGLLWPPERRIEIPCPDCNIPNILSESLVAYQTGSCENAVQNKFLIESIRSHENSTIQKDAERALQGFGIQRTIIGQFGLGKTRLIKFVAENTLRPRFNIISVAALQYQNHSKQKLHPNEASCFVLLSLIDQLLDIRTQDGSTLIQRLENDWHTTRDDLLRKVNDTKSDAQNTLDTGFWNAASDLILKLIQEALNIGPLAILLDDLQRCNIVIYRLLDHTRTLVEHSRAIVLIGYDPAEISTFSEIAGIGKMPCFNALFGNRLVLSLLSESEMLQLLKTSWKLNADLSRRITDAAYGNPYYATAIVQHLSQSSRLQTNENGLSGLSDNDRQPLGVPSVVKRFLLQKLKEVEQVMGTDSDFFREILIRISAFGASVSMDELETFWDIDDDKALSDCWREAVAAWSGLGILTITQPGAHTNSVSGRVSFAEPWHADILQATLTQRRIRALKSQAAMAMLECHKETTPEQSYAIARLWSDAGDVLSFVQSTQQSAEQAKYQAKFHFASDRYREIASLFEQITSSGAIANDIFKAIDWPKALIDGAEISIYLDDARQFEQYCHHLKAWVEHFDQPIYLAHIQRINAKRQLRSNNPGRAAELARLSQESFTICNDQADAMRSLVILAQAQAKLDDPRNARQQMLIALEYFIEHDLTIDTAKLQFKLAQLEWFAGNTADARELIAQALEFFTSEQIQFDKILCQFFLCLIDFLNAPDRVRLEKLQNLANTITAFGNESTTIYVQSLLAVSAILCLDWQIIHKILAIVPPKTACASILLGTQLCIKAIEFTLKEEHAQADNDFTTAIACFGPQNRRSRAWCHLLLGAHASFTHQLKQGMQAFERARNDFQTLNDRIGICSVLVCQSSLAISCGQYEDAFTMALDALQAANESHLPIQAGLALSIAAHACVLTGKWADFDLCQLEVTPSYPPFFVQACRTPLEKLAALASGDPNGFHVFDRLQRIIHQAFDDAPSLDYPSLYPSGSEQSPPPKLLICAPSLT